MSLCHLMVVLIGTWKPENIGDICDPELLPNTKITRSAARIDDSLRFLDSFHPVLGVGYTEAHLHRT